MALSFTEMALFFQITLFVGLDATLHKKWSLPLRISSVNVTKSAVFQWKTSFFVQFYSLLLKYQFLRRSKNVSSSLVLAIILSKQIDKTFFSKVALCFVTKWKLKFHQIWWHQKPLNHFCFKTWERMLKNILSASFLWEYFSCFKS